MVHPPLSFSSKTLHFSGYLASFLSNPLVYCHDIFCEVDPFEGYTLKKFQKNPFFAKEFNAIIAKKNGFDVLNIPEHFFENLEKSPFVRLSVVLLCSPLKHLEDVAFYLATLVFHKRIIGLIMKEDRLLFRSALGEEQFGVATREAPLLNFGLSELDLLDDFSKIFLVKPASPKEISDFFLRLGLYVIACYLDSSESFIAPLMEKRWSPTVEFSRRHKSVAPFAEKHRVAFLKILTRKYPKWLTIIH